MPYAYEEIAVNDLLGRPPGWLLRSGITLVFLVVSEMLILAAFIRYPDELTGTAVVQHESLPIGISPGITASLDTLLVKEGDSVRFKQILGVLKSGANWQQVLMLERELETVDLSDDTGTYLDNLGTLQKNYSARAMLRDAYRYLMNGDDLATQLWSTAREVRHHEQLIATTEKQIGLLDRQIELENKDYQRETSLANEKIISARELEQKEKTWLAMRERRTLLEADIIRYQLNKEQLQQQSFLLRKSQNDKRLTLARDFKELTEQLSGQIQEWKEQFLLRAPADGYVILNDNIVEKQLVNIADQLMVIQPKVAVSSPLVAKITVSVRGIGKLHEGDKVIIRLDAYPEKEFGVLTTMLARVSVLPRTDQNGEISYVLEAPLPDPVVTNFGRQLKLSLTTSGTGTVITQEQSVLSRIFTQLVDLVKTAY